MLFLPMLAGEGSQSQCFNVTSEEPFCNSLISGQLEQPSLLVRLFIVPYVLSFFNFCSMVYESCIHCVILAV
jgi:hypothetical protein